VSSLQLDVGRPDHLSPLVRVPAIQIKIDLQSTCRPTAQTLPLNWRDCGGPRWQLPDKITMIAGVHVRGRSTFFALREAGSGPSRRWRSPELAAGCWGSSAATVASGPQGATYAPDRRAGQFPQDRGTEGPQAQVAGPTGSARGPSGGPGWSLPARWRRASCRRERVLVLSLANASAWPQAAPPTMRVLPRRGVDGRRRPRHRIAHRD
jgi:hypothetical protein